MIDYSPTLIAALKTATGLEVYSEDFLTSEVQLPCLSYMLSNDVVAKQGDTLGYSDIYYYVKVYSKKASEIATNALKVDTKMRSLGFKRVGVTEVWLNGIGQYQMRYKALGQETFS